MSEAQLHLKLNEGARIERDNGVLCVVDGDARRKFGELSDTGRQCVLKIEEGTNTIAEIRGFIAAEVDPSREATLLMILRLLSAAGVLRFGLVVGSSSVAEIVPENDRFLPLRDSSTFPRPARLLPHTSLTYESDGWTLSSPLADCRIVVKQVDALAALFALVDDRLREPCTAEPEIAKSPASVAFLTLLRQAGFMSAGNDARARSGAFWTRHDLEFHRRTRLGYTAGFKGAKQSVLPQESVVPHIPESDTVTRLPPWHESRLERASLLSVLATRQSHREPGKLALELPAISAFLAATFAREREDGLSYRPFPRAGGLDLYGVYLMVRDCRGLDKGFYCFDAKRQTLLRLSVNSEVLSASFERAAGAMGAATPPQAIVTVTARFDAINRHYQDTAYRLVLLTGGAILQTMYLTATALGLAPCALGSGDSVAFCRQVGLDPLVEDAILEFALSSRSEA